VVAHLPLQPPACCSLRQAASALPHAARASLTRRGGAEAVAPLLGEVAGILVHAYADPFHEMIKAAAVATEAFCATLPRGALDTHLTTLIKVRDRVVLTAQRSTRRRL
jgi:hypothetical protein